MSMCRTRSYCLALPGTRMSIRLPKYRSDSSRTNEPNNLIIVSSLVIGLLAGATGTYFFEHGFHESGPVLLGIVGILAGGTISGWHNWCKFDRARRAHPSGNMPQIRFPWDYRPRQGSQRHAFLGSAGAETGDTRSLTGPVSNIDESVWFDFPSANSPTREDVRANSPTAKALRLKSHRPPCRICCTITA
jgi:hypothetical protein